jgi:predicted ATPase
MGELLHDAAVRDPIGRQNGANRKQHQQADAQHKRRPQSLRRLAIFVGHFTLDAALEVVTSPTVDRSAVFSAVDSLVAKSMVTTHPIGAMVRYRLLDTTRAFALDIGIDDAEAFDLSVRHATFYRRWLEQFGSEWASLSTGVERTPHFAALNNVRAALEWCFGVAGDPDIGVPLAAAAVSILTAMSLLTECHRCAEQAISALDDAARGSVEEMHLLAALGLSLILMRGGTETARAALSRSLEIAEARGDGLDQFRLLALLHGYYLTIGDFKAALTFARRASTFSKSLADPAALALAHSILGISLTHTGDLASARVELEAALRREPGSQRPNAIYLGFDGYVWAGIFLARTLWLQGHPDQAVARAHQSIKDAEATDHPVTLSIVLIRAITLFLWMGDLETAEELLKRFILHVESHSMGPYLSVGEGYQGLLAILRGDAKTGVERVQRALAKLHSARYELLTAIFNIGLVQGLAAIDQSAQAYTLTEDAIRRVEESGELSYIPELLRVKSRVLLSMPQDRCKDAEACLLQSLEWSRRQIALAWELRSAIDLAALWADQGRVSGARALLQPVFERFPQGLDTADLKSAKRLLKTLAAGVQ